MYKLYLFGVSVPLRGAGVLYHHCTYNISSCNEESLPTLPHPSGQMLIACKVDEPLMKVRFSKEEEWISRPYSKKGVIIDMSSFHGVVYAITTDDKVLLISCLKAPPHVATEREEDCLQARGHVKVRVLHTRVCEAKEESKVDRGKLFSIRNYFFSSELDEDGESDALRIRSRGDKIISIESFS